MIKQYFGEEVDDTWICSVFGNDFSGLDASVKDNFGLGEPDRIEYGGFTDAGGDAISSEWITYNLYYGDDYVAVDWIISTDDILGIAGKNLIK